MNDPHDPAIWFELLLRGLVGLQRNSTQAATVYLQFVERYRGRAVATAARPKLWRLAGHPAFANALEQLTKLEKRHEPHPVPKPSPTIRRKPNKRAHARSLEPYFVEPH